MANLLFLLVTLALVAASNGNTSGALAAADEDADLAQRRETMAEAVRVFSDPKLAAAADYDTVGRMAAFMQREIGPLGPILEAIDKMPESSAADVRAKDEAFDAAFGLLIRHFLQLMPKPNCFAAKTDDL